MPRLYIVATPIGNLGDISPRALDVLRNVSLIAAEDTRVTRQLLNHFEIRTPCVSNHRHNEEEKASGLAARMLEEDIDVALVTDAGTPAVSDPGSFLVHEAAEAGIEVLAVPGACAMASALSVSGFDTREFAFYGFLPRKKSELEEKLRMIARSGVPIAVVHESPHRVIDFVRIAADTLPGCRISASCDLTKLHEKTIRGTAEEVLAMLEADEKAEKGEYCLVLDLHEVTLEDKKKADDGISPEALILQRLMEGMDLREASAAVAELGVRRNELYRAKERVRAFLEDYGMEED